MNSSPITLRLVSGSITPAQAVQEPVRCVCVSQVQAQPALECGLDSFRFFQPQQPVVHKDAGQLLAHGPVEKGGRDGGVHPAGEGADDPSVSHLLPDAGYGIGHHVARRPGADATAGAKQEILQDRLAQGRVIDLRVELEAEYIVAVADGRDRRILGVCEAFESRRQGFDPVAVAHPDLE